MEKCDKKRAVFLETIRSYPQSKLYYIDECGIDRYLYREYGYAPRGVPVVGNISGRKFKRTNIVAAKCVDEIVAPMIYDGTTDSVLFEHWFIHIFLVSVPKGSIIIMDNATFHRKTKLHEMANVKECTLTFLPPYSPDLNPIEKYWAWLKKKLRCILPLYDNFDDALRDCF